GVHRAGGGRVDLVERRRGRIRRDLHGLRGRGVVHRDDVLDLLGLVDAGEGVDAGAVGRVALDLDAVGQGRVVLAELGQRGYRLVERVRGVVLGGRVGAGRADLLVGQVVGGLGREHVLPGVLVTARAGEALLVAVVDDGLAAGQ